MRGMWREIAGLVLPAGCAGCGRPRTELCAACRGALLRGAGGRGPRRVRPDPAPARLPRVCAAAPYADEVRATVLAHKERGALGLAGPLGAALAGAIRALRPGGGPLRGPLLLVPVPSARRSVAGRGHDPVRRMALAAGRELRRGGADARVLAVLRQRRPVADQAGLSASQRRRNLSGALEVAAGGGRLLMAAPVVLVDDLVTTGASLAEAAQVIEGAGGRVVGAAVVAAPTRAFETNWN
ncbi:ComF family protein [Streptomyces sp. MST-110588]|uniref:ComF family protein n=1 Tax=Streptomyces sp. MST-110588 TaxID=2833628 RepID=UPI001F5C2678|nr:ComF family protein [Streptomyces sp. MST-110588]UNO41713.1 ComF family protein [Streptomyces sp. MST-110588]